MQTFWGILIPFLGTALGAACVFFMKKALSDAVQRSLTGFAAGVMVAASVWSLLIPAIEQSAGMGKLSFLPAFLGFWLGILFLLALDHIIPHLHANSAQAEGPKSRLQRTTMMVLAVTLHNIPEGMAVGVVYAGYRSGSAQITAAGALALSLGIAIQNFPEGAIISMPLRAEGMSKGRAFWGGVLSGVVEPIFGVLVVLAAGTLVIHYAMKVNYRPIQELTESLGRSDADDLESLKDAIASLAEQNNHMRSQLMTSPDGQALKDSLLFSLLKGKFDSFASYNIEAEALGMSFTKPCYQVLMLRAFNQDTAIPRQTLSAIFAECFGDDFTWQFRELFEHSMFVCLVGMEADEESKLADCCRRLLDISSEKYNLVFSIGMSNCYTDVAHLSTACFEATQAVKEHFIRGQHQLIPYHELTRTLDVPSSDRPPERPARPDPAAADADHPPLHRRAEGGLRALPAGEKLLQLRRAAADGGRRAAGEHGRPVHHHLSAHGG